VRVPLIVVTVITQISGWLVGDIDTSMKLMTL